MKKLKTMGDFVVAVCAKVWKSAGFLVCGEAGKVEMIAGL